MPHTRQLIYDLSENAGHIKCMLRTSENGVACNCGISVDYDKKSWNITKWETRQDLRGTGLGKAAMLEAMRYIASRHGLPITIKYTWNGQNQYVMDWLTKRFGAECMSPIAVQKYQSEDDWSSHEYRLDVLKVLSYFKLVAVKHFTIAMPNGHTLAHLTIPEDVTKDRVEKAILDADEVLAASGKRHSAKDVLDRACRQQGWYWRNITPDTEVTLFLKAGGS